MPLLQSMKILWPIWILLEEWYQQNGILIVEWSFDHFQPLLSKPSEHGWQVMRKGAEDMYGLDRTKLAVNVDLPPDRVWAGVWCHSLASLQELDAGEVILCILYIMVRLELCFLWNRFISGCGHDFPTSTAAAKTIVHDCFESRPSSMQSALFNIKGFYQHLVECSGHGNYQYKCNVAVAHVLRAHWSQHATYHPEADDLTMEWHLENSAMVPTVKSYYWRLE